MTKQKSRKFQNILKSIVNEGERVNLEKDLVSIITPVYNAEDFLSETIESVLRQTYVNFEFLLVNDQSTDQSVQIIQNYAKKDGRICYFELEKNSGAAVARNYGIENAKGQFIAFIDSDDIWDKNKLKWQLEWMKDHQEAFTYTAYRMVSENGEMIKEVNDQLPKRLDYSGLLKNTAIACSTVMIDREVVGDFKMPLKRKGQDTATWLKILRDHDYACLVPIVLNNYRQREGSLSENKFKALARTWDTYRNYEKLPFFKAAYYFVHYAINAARRRI